MINYKKLLRKDYLTRFRKKITRKNVSDGLRQSIEVMFFVSQL